MGGRRREISGGALQCQTGWGGIQEVGHENIPAIKKRKGRQKTFSKYLGLGLFLVLLVLRLSLRLFKCKAQ